MRTDFDCEKDAKEALLRWSLELLLKNY